jgi:hypothetical protein
VYAAIIWTGYVARAFSSCNEAAKIIEEVTE